MTFFALFVSEAQPSPSSAVLVLLYSLPEEGDITLLPVKNVVLFQPLFSNLIINVVFVSVMPHVAVVCVSVRWCVLDWKLVYLKSFQRATVTKATNQRAPHPVSRGHALNGSPHPGHR